MCNIVFLCFYNECRKYYAEKMQYFLNEVANIIGNGIFLFGILFVMKIYYPVFKFLFLIQLWQWYVFSEVLKNAVSHLETEIRMNYFENIRSQRYSIWTIYFFRGIMYYIESTIIFFILVFLWCRISNVTVIYNGMVPISFFAYFITSLVLFLCIYYSVLCTVIKYKRASVFVSFMTTVMLFMSGMVFETKWFVKLNIFYKMTTLLYHIDHHTIREIAEILIVLIMTTLMLLQYANYLMRK